MMLRRSWYVCTIVGLAAAGVLVVPSLVRAHGADAINACVSDCSGIVRVVQNGDSCEPNEHPLSWNVSGPPGPSGVSGYEIVSNQELVPGGAFAQVLVQCPAGKKVLGGGFSVETPSFVQVFSSGPGDGQGNIVDTTWDVIVQNSDTQPRFAQSTAICARVH